MTRPVYIRSLVVATSIRPLFTTANAFRRLATTQNLAQYQASKSRFFSTTQSTKFARTSPKMVVHTVQGRDAFQDSISVNQLVVVDFFATWCGPCKAIAPQLAKWSNEDQFSNVNFVKVDVDESPDVAQEQGVRAMPTFFLFKNGEKVGELVGADPKKLLDLITSNK